jgi:hypothetical protein
MAVGDQPIYAEVWASPPDPPAVVVDAHPAAAPGALDTFQMGGGYAAYPVADPAARPPTVFRIYDPADPREIIRVGDTGGAHLVPSPVWQVTRATEDSSAAVGHAAGFEVRPFITKASMDGRARGTTSRTGLKLRPRLAGPVTYTGNADNYVAELLVPGGEAISGSLYEIIAWGYYTAGPMAGTAPNAGPHFNCGGRWSSNGNPGQLEMAVLGAVTGTAGLRWRIHAAVNLYGVTLTATISLWAARSTNPSDPVPVKGMFGPVDPWPQNVLADSTFALRIGTGTTGPYTFAGPPSVTVQGARSWRAA